MGGPSDGSGPGVCCRARLGGQRAREHRRVPGGRQPAWAAEGWGGGRPGSVAPAPLRGAHRERAPLGRPLLPLEVHRAEGCWGWACPEEQQRDLGSRLPTLVPCSGLFLLRASCNQPQGPGSQETFQEAAGTGRGASTLAASSLPCRRRADSGLPPRTGLAVWLLEASPQPQRVPRPWGGRVWLAAHLGSPA